MKAGETDGPATELAVDGLVPGKHYKFRVKAVNKEGASEPLTTTQSIHAKNPYGEYADVRGGGNGHMVCFVVYFHGTFVVC